MNDHTLHRGRIHVCCCCLQTFCTEEILKLHIKDCFKINSKQMIGMPKTDEYVKFKNFEIKLKSPFMIYGDFKNILVLEDNRNQNPKESYTNKYQKYLACRFFFYQYIITHTFKQHKNTITRFKYIGSTWKRHKKKFLIKKKLTKNN